MMAADNKETGRTGGLLLFIYFQLEMFFFFLFFFLFFAFRISSRPLASFFLSKKKKESAVFQRPLALDLFVWNSNQKLGKNSVQEEMAGDDQIGNVSDFSLR